MLKQVENKQKSYQLTEVRCIGPEMLNVSLEEEAIVFIATSSLLNDSRIVGSKVKYHK